MELSKIYYEDNVAEDLRLRKDAHSFGHFKLNETLNLILLTVKFYLIIYCTILLKDIFNIRLTR